MNHGDPLLGVVLDANVYIDAVSTDNLGILGDPIGSTASLHSLHDASIRACTSSE